MRFRQAILVSCRRFLFRRRPRPVPFNRKVGKLPLSKRLVAFTIGSLSGLAFHHGQTQYKSVLKAASQAAVEELPGLSHSVVEMSDALYQKHDHLCIFHINSVEEVDPDLIEDCIAYLSEVNANPPFTYAYAVDPEVPVHTLELPFTLLKGPRKLKLTYDPEDEGEQELFAARIAEFMQPRSEDIPDQSQNVIERVSYSTFQSKVLDAARTGRVLVQTTQDACSACFLIAPMMTRVASILKEHQIDLALKRLDTIKNDFPPGFPVTRYVPSFIYYKPLTFAQRLRAYLPGGTPYPPATVWEVDIPSDIIMKLIQELQVSDELATEMKQSLRDLDNRFQVLGNKFLWLHDLTELQYMLMSSLTKDPKASRKSQAASKEDERGVEKPDFIDHMLRWDVSSEDNFEMQAKQLEAELESLKQDCATIIDLIGEKSFWERMAHDESELERLKKVKSPQDLV